ncbi:hypothetical protein CEUSTIGMA_g8142.t1 [Chlamydomonas eustigma]|uniref:AAA+ ATPase domain-containing protein n=1 Tax=Chlamydomonas eustigma TaxID=1157962 RepID=A0A250XC84_9CHLO|nr:hypothetical protein CEUSTIGMA_g8142.t1 [Chlamydomonas eustigma]|eukprot:GAX80707.1 hypothetical protein CEUSTIGMA_g8142.t1 [Chlamydomonas eustigma]
MVEKSSVNSSCEDEREHIDEDSKENEGTAATSYFSKHSRHLPAPDTLKRAGLLQCSRSSDKSEKDEQQTCGAPPQNEGREHDGLGLMAGHEGQNMRSEIQDQYTTSQHVSLHETVACNITLDPEATIKAQTPHVPPDRNKGHNATVLMMFMPMAERKTLLQASRSVNVPKDAKPSSEDISPPQLPANLQGTPPSCHTIVNILTGKTAPNLDPNDSSTSLSTSGQAFRKTIEEQQHTTEQATHNRVAVELDKQQPTALTAFGSGSAGVVQRLRLSRSRGNSLDSKPAMKAKSAPVSTVVLTALEAAGAAFIIGSSIHTIHTAAPPDPPSRDDQSLLAAVVVAVSSNEEEQTETKTEDPSPDSALLGAGDKFKESILRPTPIIPLQGTEKLVPLLAAKGQQETAAPTTVCSIFLTPSQRRALAVSNKQAKVAASATQGMRETVDTVAELVPDNNPQTGGVASIRDPALGDTAALASTSAALASCPSLHQDHADVTTTVDKELEDRSLKDIGVDLVLVGTTSGSEKVQQSTVDLTLPVDPPEPHQPIMQSAPSTADPTQESQVEKRSHEGKALQDPHVVSLSLLPPPHTQALQQGQDLSIEPLPLCRKGSALPLTVSCSNLKDAFSSKSQPHQLSGREESGCEKKRKKGGGRLSRSIRKPLAGAETVTSLMKDIADPAGEAKSEVVPGAEVLITEDIAEVLIVAESATENTRGAQVTFVAEAQAERLSLEGDLESATAVITLEDGVDAASTKIIVCNKEGGPSLPSKDAEGDAKIYAIPECQNIGLGPLLKPESSSSEIVTLAMETSGPAISRRLSRKRSSSASNLRTDTWKGGNNKVHVALKGSSTQAVQVEDVVEVMDNATAVPGGLHPNATAVPGGLHPKMTKQHPAVSTKFKMNKPQLGAGAAEMMSSAISSHPLVSTIQLPVDVPPSRHDDPSSASLVVDLVCSPSSRDSSLELAELPCSSLGRLPILKANAAVDIKALDIMTPLAARITDVEICSLTQNRPSTLTDSVTDIPPSKRKAAVLPMFLPMAERKRIQQVQAAAPKQKTIAVETGAEAATGVNALWDHKTELEGTVQMWQSGDPAPPLLPTALLTSELGFDFNARSVEDNASSNPTSKPSSAAVPAAHHTVSGGKSADSHVMVTTVNPFFMARRSVPAKPAAAAAAASLSGSTSAGGLSSIPHLTGSAYRQALKPELPCIHVQQLDPSTTDQYDRTSRFHDVKLPQLLGTLLSFPEASASSSGPAAKTVSANAWTTIPLQVKGANDSLLLTAKESCCVVPLSQIQQDLAADASKCTTTVIQEARHALQRDSTTLHGHSEGLSVAVLEQRKKLRAYIQRETDALFARGAHVLASCRFWPPSDLLPSQSRPAIQGGIINASADPPKSRGGALAVQVNPKSSVSEENNMLLRQLSLQLAVMEKNSSNYAVPVDTYDDSDQQLLDVVTPDEVYCQLQNQLVGMRTSAGANVISAYLKANHLSFPGLKEDNCISSSRDARLGDRQVVMDPARRLISILPWPVKYQPRRAADMCGNGEGVQQLRSWLMAWLNKINGLVQGVSELHPQEGSLPSWDVSGDCGSWLAGDDEDEEGGGRTGRMMSSRGGINAIALTGPPGCGKTAAVTACALELGLDVIEVNASSDERTGADLLRLIGEATQSRRLAHMVMEQQQQATSRAQQKNYWGPQSKLSSHGTDELEGKKKNKQRAKRKVISDDDSEAPCDADTVIRKKTAASKSAGQPALEKSTKGGSYKEAAQVGLLPSSLEEETTQKQRGCLVLFEGVDLLHDADRGFLAALSEIIEESKRPLVLTMNSPHLPAPLEGKGITVLPFKPPCATELLRLVALVSAGEGVGHQASSEILDSRVSTEEGEPTAGYALSTDFLPQTARLVRACNGDIRAALMTSQFWWSTLKGTTALGITREQLADIRQHTPPCPLKLCCSDAAVWTTPMQQFTAALTPERDAVQAYRHACAEGTMQAVRDLDLWLLATVDALCAASYTELSSETAAVPEPRDCAGLRPEHLNDECSVPSVKMTDAHQGKQEEAAGMVMHSEEPDVQLTGKHSSFSTLVSTDLGMNSNSIVDPTASSSYGSLNAGSNKRQEELAAYHAACSDVHASILARGWSAHHAERISQAREQRRARSKASSSKRKSKKGFEDDADIMMPELDDSAAPPMTSRFVSPGLEVAPLSENHCVEDDAAGDIRHPGATETMEAIIHHEPLTKGVDAMEANHSEPHSTAEDAMLSAACLAGSDMPIASPLVRSPTCMDGVIDSPPDIRGPDETNRGFTTNAMAGPHGKLRSSAAEVRQLLALIPSTDQKVKGITDGVMSPQFEGVLVEDGRGAGPDSDGDGSVGGDGSMGGDGLVGNGAYFTDKSRGEISHPDGLPHNQLQRTLSHGVSTNPTDAGPIGSNHNNGLAEDEMPCFRLSDHQRQVLQQLLSSDMVSLQGRPSLPLFPPEPPLLLRPGTTCLRPEAAVSQEANRACSVTAHGHASWSQQQQEFTALRVLSRCHELLSQCCVLAASRDPLPVSSGPAPLPHHAMQLASFPMLPGRNTAVFASSFMVVGTPPCRPLVTADAMREEDGSCPAACMEEMIQEELKQGSRQALPGCGSEELYASGSSSSRGLSLGQQAAGEVAALLLNHVKRPGCRVGTCGSCLLPEVKEQEEASTTSTDLYDLSYDLLRSYGVYPGQVMNCISCHDYQRLSQMNEVLISAHPRAAMLSCQASAQYLGSLRGMCHYEALRQEDAMICAGRGRRAPRFKHYVQETCPDVSEESVIALLSSCKFGTG